MGDFCALAANLSAILVQSSTAGLGLACVGFENPHLIGLTIWDIVAWGGTVHYWNYFGDYAMSQSLILQMRPIPFPSVAFFLLGIFSIYLSRRINSCTPKFMHFCAYMYFCCDYVVNDGNLGSSRLALVQKNCPILPARLQSLLSHTRLFSFIALFVLLCKDSFSYAMHPRHVLFTTLLTQGFPRF